MRRCGPWSGHYGQAAQRYQRGGPASASQRAWRRCWPATGSNDCGQAGRRSSSCPWLSRNCWRSSPSTSTPPDRAPSRMRTMPGKSLATSLKRKRRALNNRILERPPHELQPCVGGVGRLRGGCLWLECSTTPTTPLTPSIANRCRRIWFLSVVRGHRPVARWRPPRWTLLLRGQRTELEAQRRRLPLQRLQDVGLHLGLVLFHRLRHVLLAVLEHPVDQTRQLVRGRLGCSESADPTADAAVEQAQRRHCPAQ